MALGKIARSTVIVTGELLKLIELGEPMVHIALEFATATHEVVTEPL
jgi:hypothetical protein